VPQPPAPGSGEKPQQGRNRQAGSELTGRVYLVAGGAGVAGECITAALLRYGATVAVPSRSEERIDRLRSAIDPSHLNRLHTIVGEVGDPGGVLNVRRELAELAWPLDGVVASLGSWWEGVPLTRLPYLTWQQIMHDNLTTHYLVARTFLPELADRRGSAYIALAGVAAHLPLPHAGPISVTGAAQTMLIRTLAAQYAREPVRLHQVSILTPIVTRHWGDAPIEPGWLTCHEVGEYIAAVAAPGFAEHNRLALWIPEPEQVAGLRRYT
jgi:NAD(P)-dependent dehydrogenase (short-subunit alcohol dehydrogenase family)